MIDWNSFKEQLTTLEGQVRSKTERVSLRQSGFFRHGCYKIEPLTETQLNARRKVLNSSKGMSQ